MSVIDDIEPTQRNPEGLMRNDLLQRLDDVTNDSLDNFVCQEENNLDILRKEQEIQEIETEIVEVQSRLEELHCRKRKCVREKRLLEAKLNMRGSSDTRRGRGRGYRRGYGRRGFFPY